GHEPPPRCLQNGGDGARHEPCAQRARPPRGGMPCRRSTLFIGDGEDPVKKRIKSFRVARRCESSVGLTWIGARRRGMEFSGGLRGGEMAGRAGMRGKVVYGLGCGAARGGSKKWARDASVARRA